MNNYHIWDISETDKYLHILSAAAIHGDALSAAIAGDADAKVKFEMEADADTLFDAAIAGDADARAKLSMETSKLDHNGETILHVESKRGNAERVKFILREFPNVNNLIVQLSKDKETALHWPAYYGHTEVVEVLNEAARHLPSSSFQAFLRQGDKYKKTALHLAVEGGHTEVVEVLIEAARHLPSSSANDDALDNPVNSFQAFLRQGDKDMDTALHAAVARGNVDIVKLLVEADQTDRHIQNNQGKTPMYIAVEEGFHEIVEIISTTCTAPSLDGPYGDIVVRIDNLDQVKSHSYKIKDRYAFYDAAIAGDADAIANLEMEADKLDYLDQTILHIESRLGKTECVRFLLKEFANKNLLVKLNRFKRTALHLAVYGGHTEVVEVLIEAARHLPSSSANDDTLHNPVTSFQAFLRQVDTNIMNTALHAAVARGHVDIVKLLVKADPTDRHSQNDFGRTPMYIAVERGLHEIVKIISTTCTAPSLDGPDGTTALRFFNEAYQIDEGIIRMIINAAKRSLILAIRMRDKDSVLHLLKYAKHAKDLVTFVDDKGWTPLHYAAFHEFDSVLEAIIEAQKNLGYQFIYKDMVQTPLLVAAEKGYTSTVIQLMKLWPTSSSAYTAIKNDGQNILHLAAAKNKKVMIQGILKYCPEKYKDKILKQQDVNGDTPLHLLISYGCFIPELIKHRGLDTMVRNKRNWTPRDMLYSTDDITADQVKIKIALDDVQTNQSRKFWRKKKKTDDILETDILESLVLPSKRETKDVKFNENGKLLMDEKRAQMKKDLERYKKRTSTQIVVATLITTITFTVGFTMPGGLHQSGEVDEGLVVLTKKAAFNAFMVSDALAFLLSTCSLFLYFLESMNEDPRQVSKLNAASVGLNIVSVMAMMLTFITGTYVVLSHSAVIAITVCLIGSFFFIFVIVLLIKTVYDHQVKRNED